MILKEFAKFLQENSDKDSVFLMNVWLQEKLKTPTHELTGKIIQQELYLAKNKNGSFIILGKNESGRILMKTLYNFSLSYEHYKQSKIDHAKNLKNKNNTLNQ